ncbi:DEAD-box family (RNA) helicase, putative [Theileria annulata]|uniref:RNA helicase n=1 Tax=Theileria annulata TaxID=5874 RepID=Q4UBV5_THEAN|nr:DEAD-box family (RNA) helicase, putative [Theileria annulata]CAI75696.1 DEAD-box family (RNA) helicase, putative [Theileria annulata]|eukprot:XP_955172.1 DEAD-box family (RNA) helicase, putative [Theileria annulata]
MENDMNLKENTVKPIKKVYLPPNRRNPPPESLNINKNISNTLTRQYNGNDLLNSNNKNSNVVERNIPLNSDDINSFSSNLDRNLRLSTDRSGDRTTERTTERTSERTISSTSERTIGDRTSERTISSTSGRTITTERSITGDRTTERTITGDRTSERTISTTSDRTFTSDRMSDRMGDRIEKKYSRYYSGKVPTLWAIRGDRRYYEEKESEVFEPKNRMSTGINFNSYDNIPVQMTGHESGSIKPIEEFDTSVHSKLVPNIRKVNYTKPTPIQRHSIPVILAGRDLMACAQTGSGKTAAFLLPIVTSMLRTGPPKQPSLGPLYNSRVALPVCLVLSPTRELAVQTYTESRKFNFGTGIRTVVLYGGSEVRRQLIELERGCDICVATPGRLTDLVERRKIVFSCIKYLVLDEADRMLDMGFSPQIKSILSHPTMTSNVDNSDRVRGGSDSRVSSIRGEGRSTKDSVRDSMETPLGVKEDPFGAGGTTSLGGADTVTGDTVKEKKILRQTVMFSATFPKEIQQLAREFLNDYIYLAVGRVGSTNEFIKQRLLYADQDQKIKYLIKLLKDNTNLGGLVLIFVETKKRADLIEGYLLSENFKAVNIHGDRSQEDREKALSLFKAGVRPIMVATDVAARGLDISNITHVINCDLPTNIDDYVHRIGRTGRAGNIGIATSLVNESNRPILKDLLLLLQESNQEIPIWFKKLVNTISKRNTGKKFIMTRDVDLKKSNTNTFQEFEDDWCNLTEGKGANSTAMECTTGKGANYTFGAPGKRPNSMVTECIVDSLWINLYCINNLM